MTIRQLLTVSLLLITITGSAQNTALKDSIESRKITFEPKKFYFSGDFEGAIISIATNEAPNSILFPIPGTVNTPRFTYFWNVGYHLNYDINNIIGFFVGLGIKNIGFIEKFTANDSTVKRRVYTIGAPLGIKVGNFRKNTYFFLGGGVDAPFHYKEKGYVTRSKKDRFNEWFSDRTERILPYVFVGGSVKPGIFLKVQYYTGSFMNQSYTTSTSNLITPLSTPYANYDIRLLAVSVGIDLRYNKKMRVKYKKGDKKDPIM